MAKNITFGDIKRNCGQVYEHRFQKSGFMGHIYASDMTERCGFYTAKACNCNNCPIFNQKRGYANRLKEIQDKVK